MMLQLFEFKCSCCGGWFNAPDVAFSSYGEFLLRSSGDAAEAYLNALEDETYQEVNRLLKENHSLSGEKPNVLAKVLREVYGLIACDPDRFGNFFQIGLFPKCPHCGSQEMNFWEVIEPPRFLEKNVEPVTHALWSKLSCSEKKAKVDGVLSLLGYS